MHLFKYINKDLPAGLVVFLVALPLCLGIALASGAPLASGIISGVVGGIVVGMMSGSRLGVSGPAAGLVVIVANAIQQLGTDENGAFSMEAGFALFLCAVVLAGLLQIVLGLLRAGFISYFFPNSVIKGMLAAIGIIIILKQIPHALGHDVIAEGADAFWQNDGENTFTELWVALGDINPLATIITVVSLAVLILWDRKPIKGSRFAQVFQGPLVVVMFGITMGALLSGVGGFSLAPDEMVAIPLASEMGGLQGLLTHPDWSRLWSNEMWSIALTIAVVASLETMLCVEATDKLDSDKNITPVNRELIAQGVGNITSGLIGGLPITQVIVRSSANIQSGGKTKVSTIFHGLLIAVAALALPRLMNMIPLSSLSAILFVVGYKLAKPSVFREMRKKGSEQFLLFLITLVSIVLSDLLTGIVIGFLAGLFMILYRNYRVPFDFSQKIESSNTIEIKLNENMTFLNKVRFMEALNAIPEGSSVVIDATQSQYIHPDVVDIIEDFKVQSVNRNTTIHVEGGDFIETKTNYMAYLLKSVSPAILARNSYWKDVWKM